MDSVSKFEQAAAQMKTVVGDLSSDDLLEFYALYKQATAGPCNTPKPNWHRIQERHKWAAWKKLGNMCMEDAMQNYVAKMSAIAPIPDDVEGSEYRGWVAVSRLQLEAEIPDDEKTFFDWIKEGNEKMVEELMRETPYLVNTPDETGLYPIHWATDRAFLSIVRFLIENGAAANSPDDEGRTPLDYAIECEHDDVAQYLQTVGGVTMEECKTLRPIEF